MSVGVVKAWMEDRGFGFITEDGGSDVFVHAKSLLNGIKKLPPGSRAEFEKKVTDRGVQAFRVSLVTDQPADVVDDPDVITEEEYMQELKNIIPPLREVHKQALLENAVEHGWVD